MRCRCIVVCLAAAVACCSLAAPAVADVRPYREGDYLGFQDVLPPGANGRVTLLELASFLATGARPPHNDDQLGMYARLLSATPGVTARTIGGLFKDSSFGVRPGDQARVYSPGQREGLTVARDASFGVPHVYATTRSAAMFALGYVAAEDRLFFMDVLRHAGRAEVSAFAGGAAGNREMDADVWRQAPYTEADLQRQVDQLDDLYGDEGRKLQADAAEYAAGVNRYISEARLDVTKLPGEYAAVGKPLEDWKVTDIIATASLVGGIFGKGGGDELTQMELRRSFVARYGSRRGVALWREWAAYEDADAPTTLRGKRFPYQTPPRSPPATPSRSPTRARCAARRSSPPPRGPAAAARSRAARRSMACSAACCRRPARSSARRPTRSSCRAPSRRAGTRSRCSGRRSRTSRRRSSWSRTSTRRRSTHAERRSPASTSTFSSGAGRTTRGARRPRARTSSTRSRWSCASRTAARRRSTPRTTAFAARACRSRCSSTRTAGRPRSRTPPPPAA